MPIGLLAIDSTKTLREVLSDSDGHLQLDVLSAAIDTEAAWTTLHSAVRLDDSPTSANSANVDCDGYRGAWILCDIDSTLAPTTLQIIAQFSEDGGTTYWDYVEGVWASLFYEDTVVASGITHAYHLPLEGIDDFRIRIVAVGSDASKYFDVTIKARLYK